MLGSGAQKVPPSHNMWPLFCNEVGLSYDQEEKVRTFQRTILQNHDSWLARHTGAASALFAQNMHDCVQAAAGTVRNRSAKLAPTLDETKRVRLSKWCEANNGRLQKWRSVKSSPLMHSQKLDPKQHTAANLYILADRVTEAQAKMKEVPVLVSGIALKRLSRRPSFESLGNTGTQDKFGKDHDDPNSDSSREFSCASSSGSLKRSASELSEMDEDRPQPQNTVIPQEAQAAANVTIDAVLGHVKKLIPKPRSEPSLFVRPNTEISAMGLNEPGRPSSVSRSSPLLSASSAPPHSSVPVGHQPMIGVSVAPRTVPHHPLPSLLLTAEGGPTPNRVVSTFPPTSTTFLPAPAPPPPQMSLPTATHLLPPQTASFLPSTTLNTLPEEGFLPGQSAEDFFLDLPEDWAIGEGFEMDTT